MAIEIADFPTKNVVFYSTSRKVKKITHRAVPWQLHGSSHPISPGEAGKSWPILGWPRNTSISPPFHHHFHLANLENASPFPPPKKKQKRWPPRWSAASPAAAPRQTWPRCPAVRSCCHLGMPLKAIDIVCLVVEPPYVQNLRWRPLIGDYEQPCDSCG